MLKLLSLALVLPATLLSCASAMAGYTAVVSNYDDGATSVCICTTTTKEDGTTTTESDPKFCLWSQDDSGDTKDPNRTAMSTSCQWSTATTTQTTEVENAETPSDGILINEGQDIECDPELGPCPPGHLPFDVAVFPEGTPWDVETLSTLYEDPNPEHLERVSAAIASIEEEFGVRVTVGLQFDQEATEAMYSRPAAEPLP